MASSCLANTASSYAHGLASFHSPTPSSCPHGPTSNTGISFPPVLRPGNIMARQSDANHKGGASLQRTHGHQNSSSRAGASCLRRSRTRRGAHHHHRPQRSTQWCRDCMNHTLFRGHRTQLRHPKAPFPLESSACFTGSRMFSPRNSPKVCLLPEQRTTALTWSPTPSHRAIGFSA